MRILFYLPVVTPWWFDNIVIHPIRALARQHEVHVMVPPLWSGTGIGPDQLANCADLDHVAWHILDGEDHPLLRTGEADRAEILDLVHRIAPDVSFCRSADLETPAAFPGVVKHLMEGGASPFPLSEFELHLKDSPFATAEMPALTDDERAWIDAAIEPAWETLRREADGRKIGRAAMCERYGLPSNKIIVAVPLEYEHRENFFRIHSSHRRNADLVAELAQSFGDDVFLAVSNHPLNALHVDNRGLERTIAAMPDRARLIADEGEGGSATRLISMHCDGIFVENGKTLTSGAFYGKPVVRRSTFASGEWARVYDRLDRFAAGLRDGKADIADPADARTWFGYHIANNAFDPRDPEVSADELIARTLTPFDPDRWETGMARYRAFKPELFQ